MKKLVNSVGEDKNIAVTSREHAHLKNEFEDDIDNGLHRMGLIKLLKDHNYSNDIIGAAQRMQRANIKTSKIARTLLGEEDNPYIEQLETDKKVLDPLEFNYMKQYEELDVLCIDEGVDGEEQTFKFNRNIETIKEHIDTLIDNIEKEERKEDLKELKDIFNYIFRQYQEHTLFEKYDGSWTQVMNNQQEEGGVHVDIKDNDKETDHTKDYYLSHTDYLYDIESDEFQKQFRKLEYMFFDSRNDRSKLKTKLHEVVNRNIEDGEIKNKELVSAAITIRRLSNVAWESKNHDVVITERWKKNGHFKQGSGKIFGSPEQHKTFFWMSKPHIFRIFDLAIYNDVVVKWAWAGFDEDWFRDIHKQYLDYKMKREEAKYAINPERYHYGGDTEYSSYIDRDKMETDIMLREFNAASEIAEEEELSEMKVDLYKVTRPGDSTFSRGSIADYENGERVYKDKVIGRLGVIAEGFNDTGFIGYKDMCIEFDEESTAQQTLFGEVPFLYWDGGGIKGSNDFEDLKRNFLIGTPNKNPIAYIKRYYLMTGELPPLDNSDLMEESRHKSSSKLGVERPRKNDEGERTGFVTDDDRIHTVHRMLVDGAISDAALRLRNMREEKKEIFVAGVVPDSLLDSLGMERHEVERLSFQEATLTTLKEQGYKEELLKRCPVSQDEVVDELKVQQQDIRRFIDSTEDLTITQDRTIKEKESMNSEDIEQEAIAILEEEETMTTSNIQKKIDARKERVRDVLEESDNIGSRKITEYSKEKEAPVKKIEWRIK